MIGLVVLAAAAAQGMHPVRLPPAAVTRPVAPGSAATVATPPPEPVTTEAVTRTDLVARLVPDLVIKAIRVDDSGVYVQVANEGTGPAKGFSVDAAVWVGPRHAFGFVPGFIDGLAVGESKWAKVTVFSPTGEASYPPPPPFELLKATSIHANADPRTVKGGGWGTGWESLPDPSAKKDPCTGEGGCIKELHEDNNAMTVDGDAIVRGKPE